MNEPISRAIESLGMEVRGTYSGWREISIILDAVIGLEELSPTPMGIQNVRKLNGQIFQPSTHEEVLSTIQSIEELLRMNA